MIQISQILQGWGRVFLDEFGQLNPQVKAESERRLSICNTCSFRVDNTCSKSQQGRNEITNKLTRGCGCNISAKSMADKSECPAGKW